MRRRAYRLGARTARARAYSPTTDLAAVAPGVKTEDAGPTHVPVAIAVNTRNPGLLGKSKKTAPQNQAVGQGPPKNHQHLANTGKPPSHARRH
ncbi:MAG TPA: hypothetical protein VFB19_19220 [Mycobacterium sp.]|nr:hypothetical protein [Mycobacterium sp.]